MAKSPKKISKVSDKLTKVDTNFSINIYDNGFLVEVGGRDAADDWATAKIMVSDEEALIGIVREIISMENS
jgi:hypothetical protein